LDSRKDRQTTWHIIDLPDGWELVVHFRVRLAALLPRYARLNRTPFITGMLMWTLMVLGLAWMVARFWIPAGFYLASLAPLLAFVFTALMWPLRYGKGAQPSEYAYLRYVEGNRIETVRASRSTIDVPAGVFELHHLRNLEVRKFDPELDLYGLTFWGDVEHAQVFRWPGVSEADAIDMRLAILERVEAQGSRMGTLTSAST